MRYTLDTDIISPFFLRGINERLGTGKAASSHLDKSEKSFNKIIGKIVNKLYGGVFPVKFVATESYVDDFHF
jgi:hypothetical protein